MPEYEKPGTLPGFSGLLEVLLTALNGRWSA